MKLLTPTLLLFIGLAAAQCEDPSDDSGRCDYGNQYLCKRATGGKKYNNCAAKAKAKCNEFCPSMVSERIVAE